MSTPAYYALIPYAVRYDKRLRPAARLLYGELTALANKNGVCTARNEYFAELYDVDVKTISRWISQLRDYGYIEVEILQSEGNRREISIDKKVTRSGQKNHEVGAKKSLPRDEKVTPYNRMNNTINNTINSGENAHDFLEQNYPSDYEQFCMHHKTALGPNWGAFVDDFNCKVEIQEIPFDKPRVMFAFMKKLALNWVRFEQNKNKGVVNMVPAGAEPKPQYRNNIV